MIAERGDGLVPTFDTGGRIRARVARPGAETGPDHREKKPFLTGALQEGGVRPPSDVAGVAA